MSDTEDDFTKAFEGFGEDPAPVTPPTTDPPTPPAQPGAAAEPPKVDPPATPPATPEPKKDDETPPAEPPKKDEPATPPADPAKKPEEGAEPPKAPETPPAPEEPKPLTEESVKSIIQNIRTDERASEKELENTTKEVMDAYYPEGLSSVLTTPDGKELKTPQDVVDASGGEMSTEEAAQWLMNEQFKLDTQLKDIRNDAAKIAETTVNFKRDSIAALQKYEPLFKAYPQLQEKSFKLLMKQVKTDKEKGVVLAAPDVMDLYDTYLEPYQQAYEFATKQSATNPTPAPGTPAPGTPAPPAAPGAADRLDETGDGGTTAPDDPNDFAQQVTKELAKGI